MEILDLKELIKKTQTELHKLLSDYRGSLRELRFKDANKQLKNVREIRKIKAAIAQILTLINAKNSAKPQEVPQGAPAETSAEAR